MGMTRFGCGERAYIGERDTEGAGARVLQRVECVLIGAWSLAREVLEPCGGFEWIALSYLALSGALMIIFHQNIPHPALHIGAHFGVFAAIILIVNVADRFSRGELSHARIAPTLRWFRDWYPQLVFLFCFEELRILVHMIVPVWRDSVL